MKEDIVNHPKHYTVHPSGVECLEITEHMNFCLGNAMKYIWRADHKESDIIDLKKAIFYLEREIKRRGESKEESTRESERLEYSESDKLIGKRPPYHKKRRLLATKHHI